MPTFCLCICMDSNICGYCQEAEVPVDQCLKIWWSLRLVLLGNSVSHIVIRYCSVILCECQTKRIWYNFILLLNLVNRPCRSTTLGVLDLLVAWISQLFKKQVLGQAFSLKWLFILLFLSINVSLSRVLSHWKLYTCGQVSNLPFTIKKTFQKCTIKNKEVEIMVGWCLSGYEGRCQWSLGWLGYVIGCSRVRWC